MHIHRRLITAIILATLLAAFLPHQVYAQSEVIATVLASSLNVRQMPNSDALIVGMVAYQTQLRVTGREDTLGDGGLWVYSASLDGSISGWVRSDYLEFPAGFDIFSLPLLSGGETPAAPAAPPTTGLLPGTTAEPVNFRTGPGRTYAALRMLPGGTPVGLMGRDNTGLWLQADVNGQQGWLYAGLVQVAGDVNSLPVTVETASDGGAGPSISAGVVPVVGSRARQIFLRGQRLGNRRNVFSKVGDSITDSPYFLVPIGQGGLQLYEYTSLQPVVNFFSQAMANNNNSFANASIAARGGWTAGALLDPANVFTTGCQPGESPLVCEYRVTKPAVALIMVGTNDIAFSVPSADFRANLERIVQTSIDMGVIPVLSTIPDNQRYPNESARVPEINGIIVEVANAYGVPLWNYWQAMQNLPNHGLSTDNLHPSIPPSGETGVFSPDGLQYGYTVRNLTALMVLDAVWRGALY